VVTTIDGGGDFEDCAAVITVVRIRIAFGGGG
jgi:hypothetical protein